MYYAVFEDGSRQYRVSEGEVVKVDYRANPVGERVEFNRVLLYRNGDDTRIGQPLLEGVRVLGVVVDHPSTKLYIQKFRRRKNYRRLRGHRQWYTSVRVNHILLPGMEPPAPAPAPTPAPPAGTETPAPPTGTAPAAPPAPEPPAAPASQTPAAPPPAQVSAPPAGTETPPAPPPPAPAGTEQPAPPPAAPSPAPTSAPELTPPPPGPETPPGPTT